MKQVIIESLKREEDICKIAIQHLKKDCKKFERKYNISTNEFIKKFDQGEIGDNEDFFKWYTIASAIKDWTNKKNELKNFINDNK